MSEEELEEEVHEEPSLDQLSQAFAEAMGRNKVASQDGSDGPEDGSVLDQDEQPDSDTDNSDSAEPQSDPDDSCPISPKSIFEAVLFVGHPDNRPITGKSIANLIRGVEEDELPALMEELNKDYVEYEMPYEIVTELLVEVDESETDSEVKADPDAASTSAAESDEVATDKVKAESKTKQPLRKTKAKLKKKRKAKQGIAGYRLKLRDEFDYLREGFYGRVREAQLSQLAIDVLAVVAYNQPIAREDINRLLDTGLDTGRVINQLVRRDLLARQTNKDAGKSRRREYVTTSRFLEFFNLDSVDDLPKTDAPESLQ